MEMVRMCLSGSVLTRQEREAIERLRQSRLASARRRRAAAGLSESSSEEDSHPAPPTRLPSVHKKPHHAHHNPNLAQALLRRVFQRQGPKRHHHPTPSSHSPWLAATMVDDQDSSARSFPGRTESDEYLLRCFEEG